MTERLLRPAEVAELLAVSKTTVARLVATEGLPCRVLCVGPGSAPIAEDDERKTRRNHPNRTLRFSRAEVEKWLEGRQERKVADWTRYQRGGGRP